MQQFGKCDQQHFLVISGRLTRAVLGRPNPVPTFWSEQCVYRYAVLHFELVKSGPIQSFHHRKCIKIREGELSELLFRDTIFIFTNAKAILHRLYLKIARGKNQNTRRQLFIYFLPISTEKRDLLDFLGLSSIAASTAAS